MELPSIKNIIDVTQLSVSEAFTFFGNLPEKLSPYEKEVSRLILLKISARLSFLQDVGLKYLTLSFGEYAFGRRSTTHSTRHANWKQTSRSIICFDEPSIGLHQRDNSRLIKTLRDLQSIGNTVLVVEHDEEMMREADWLLEIGPGAGSHGEKCKMKEQLIRS